MDDLDTLLAADLAADVADPKTNFVGQDLVAILGRPDDVITVVENTVAPSGIMHVFGCGGYVAPTL